MYFNRIAYERHVAHFAGKFEERRRHFLNRLCVHLALALSALTGMILARTYFAHFSITYSLATAVGFAFTLWPVIAYRRQKHSLGELATLNVPIKEFVFSNIFHFFGGLDFKAGEGISQEALRQAPLFPEFTHITAEDRIFGMFEGIELEMSEATIFRNSSRLFQGIVILLDTNGKDSFSGTSILIQDEVKHLAGFRQRYAEYQRVPLSPEQYENRFEAISTAPEDARALFGKKFLDALLALTDALHLPAGGAATAQGEAQPESLEMVLSHDLHCSAFNGKLLITVPYDHDLFESHDLFKPALIEEDKEMLFRLMEALAEIAHRISTDRH